MTDPESTDIASRPRVALLVDGDNLSHTFAGALIVRAANYGSLTIKRVYGNVAKLPGWDAAPGFKTIHSGTGKNATDLLLAVEAMSLIFARQADILVLASSDGDFSHLAQHLVERDIKVIGLGEAKAPEHFRRSCTKFLELSAAPRPELAAVKQDPLVQKARDLIASERSGMAITLLSTRMAKNNDVQISQTPHKSWRAFLTAHSDLFDCDPKGPTAQVRLRP